MKRMNRRKVINSVVLLLASLSVSECNRPLRGASHEDAHRLAQQEGMKGMMMMMMMMNNVTSSTFADTTNLVPSVSIRPSTVAPSALPSFVPSMAVEGPSSPVMSPAVPTTNDTSPSSPVASSPVAPTTNNTSPTDGSLVAPTAVIPSELSSSSSPAESTLISPEPSVEGGSSSPAESTLISPEPSVVVEEAPSSSVITTPEPSVLISSPSLLSPSSPTQISPEPSVTIPYVPPISSNSQVGFPTLTELPSGLPSISAETQQETLPPTPLLETETFSPSPREPDSPVVEFHSLPPIPLQSPPTPEPSLGYPYNAGGSVGEESLPTFEPTAFGEDLEPIDDALYLIDDVVIKEKEDEKELQNVENEAKAAGGFGILLAILAMIFTAYQMSENPDGIYASVCRLAITVVGCCIKLMLMPCRNLFGNNRYRAGHIPVSTMEYREPYRGNHMMELT